MHTMRVVALLCLAHASALGRKKTNGPSVKVSATLAVDKKVVGKADALFRKRTAQSCDAAAKIYEAELEGQTQCQSIQVLIADLQDSV